MTKSRPGSIFSSVSKAYSPSYKTHQPRFHPPNDEILLPSSTKQKIEWSYDNEEIIAEWCDIAQCYKWLNYHSHHYYYKLHAWFTIPAITFSTISGTASFASASIPHEYQPFAPMIIGTINILIGILTTVQQFLKVSELKEAHRIASISWDKYARNISIELSKAPLERIDAVIFLKFSRQEFDRLMESNPSIPLHIIRKFKESFRGKTYEEKKHFNMIKKPDICDVIVSINEKRHMWFPKRDNVLLFPANDDVSVSVEDIETGSSSTVHVHKENTRHNSASNSNHSAFSQENLMKHNSELSRHHHLPQRHSNNSSIDKSKTRKSFTTTRNSSKDADIPSLREFVSSLNISKNTSAPPTPRTQLYFDGKSPEGDSSTLQRRSLLSKTNIHQVENKSSLDNRPENIDYSLNTIPKKPETTFFPSFNYFSRSPSIGSQEETWSVQGYRHNTHATPLQDEFKRKGLIEQPNNINKTSSSSSLASTEDQFTKHNNYGKPDIDHSQRRKSKLSPRIGSNELKAHTNVNVPKYSEGIFRNSEKRYEKPITLIPFHNLPNVHINREISIPYNIVGPTGVVGEGNIESSSGNDSGNSKNSILVKDIEKKNIQGKKKVRHEGYATNSDTEVCDPTNVSFTIDTLREYQWSDSEDDKTEVFVEQVVTEAIENIILQEVESTISSQTTSYDKSESPRLEPNYDGDTN